MPDTFSGLVNFVIEFLNLGITVLFGLAFLTLLWQLVDAWIIHADDGSKREEGRTIAITAVLVMVVMVSIWGILALLTGRL
jgi:hypothetical protein